MMANAVTDEQLGQLARKQHELFMRVKQGSVPLDTTLGALQDLVEGRLVTQARGPGTDSQTWIYKSDWVKLAEGFSPAQAAKLFAILVRNHEALELCLYCKSCRSAQPHKRLILSYHNVEKCRVGIEASSLLALRGEHKSEELSEMWDMGPQRLVILGVIIDRLRDRRPG